MNKYIVTTILAIAVFVVPGFVLAHETREYKIKGAIYAVTVGSLNEPLYVGDKSGIDLTVRKDGVELVGVEKLLKVEMSAGGQKKIFDLATVFGSQGKYKTTFYPTTADAISYRLFGKFDDVNFDATFFCSAAGHQMSGEAMQMNQEVSPGVMWTSHRGGFGCPLEKTNAVFPAPVENTKEPVSVDENVFSSAFDYIAVALSLLAIGIAMFRRNTDSIKATK